MNVLSLVDPENMEHVNKIVEMRERVKFDKIRKILEMQYELGELGEDFEMIKALEDKVKAKLDEKKTSSSKNAYVWITINPKPDINVCKFRKACVNVAKRSFFKNAMYVYEQRGDSDETIGKGFHCHMLAERDFTKTTRPSHMKRDIGNSVKNILNLNAKNPYIQFVDAEYAKDKIRYMLGDKDLHKDEKDIKLVYDKLWRDRENIEHIYGNIQIT